MSQPLAPMDTPKDGEDAATFAARVQAAGQRELHLRKALRAHFDMPLPDVIAFCANYPEARRREIELLRARFSNLSQNRFAWRIGQSMTLDKSDAAWWAEKVIRAEGHA